jgi:hypothetical protein
MSTNWRELYEHLLQQGDCVPLVDKERNVNSLRLMGLDWNFMLCCGIIERGLACVQRDAPAG